jgi:hypothetical protein
MNFLAGVGIALAIPVLVFEIICVRFFPCGNGLPLIMGIATLALAAITLL